MRRLATAVFAVVLSQTNVPMVEADFGDELLRISGSESDLHFGRSVDISGSTVIVGTGRWVPNDDPDDDSDDERSKWCPSIPAPVSPDELHSQEQVFVYDHTLRSEPIQVLTSATANEPDWFGMSVAVDNNQAIVGAPLEDANGFDSGAAYLFDVTTGQQLFKFIPDDAQPFDRLGSDVAINGNHAVVASICAQAAYIYDIITGEIVDRITGDNRSFGASVAIEDNTLIVGGTFGGGGLGGSVFAFDIATGDLQWKVESDEKDDSFGASIDVSGDRTLVGTPVGSPEFFLSGSAEILNTSNGGNVISLEPVPRQNLQNFGVSVAIDGDRALVGSLNERSATGNESGGLHVFDTGTGERLQLIWGDTVGANPLGGNTGFGSAIAVSGSTAVVGAPNAGVVHVLDLSGSPAPQDIDEFPPIKLTPGLLQPGDAERDLDFDQFDVVQILSAAKYLTGESATWGEGDWNGGPGSADVPSEGNGEFDEVDLVSALTTGLYNTGAYDNGGGRGSSSLPITCCGVLNDDKTSIVYDPLTGELAIDSPDQSLTSMSIDSSTGVFTGDPIPLEILGGVFDIDSDQGIFKATFGRSFQSLSFGNVALTNLSSSFLLSDLTAIGSLEGGGTLRNIDLVYLGTAMPGLMPGDADQDLKFDQLDVVKVAITAKYLTGQSATWGEGDWDGGPGGAVGRPPDGDGFFDQLDIIAALNGNTYLSGPYAAIQPAGKQGDSETSLVYDSATGNLSVDAPAGFELTSINIQSATAIFTESPAENLDGAFDNDTDDNIFKATFGGSFGSLSFGQVATPGLSRDFLLSDLTVQGSLDGGGALGDVDLIYIPEPTTISLLVIAVATITVLATGKNVRRPK